MTNEELYWVAGMLEGEGSFQANQTKKYRYPRIQMNSTDEDVIHRIKSVTGVGNVTGPFMYTKTPHWKPRWTWTIQKKQDALELMTLLLPLMCERRQKQIQLLLDEFA